MNFDLALLHRHQPESLSVSGRKELVDFIITFLSSTWYIKNPYLKAKLVTVRVTHKIIHLKRGALTPFEGTDYVLRHDSIRSRTERRTGGVIEYPSARAETSDALFDVVLCRQVIESLLGLMRCD